MTRFVVVTGTDTGVGKTFVTEALARRWAADRRVVAIKPFESGSEDGVPGDGERLAAATGQTAPLRALVRLRAPLTPAVAADREGVVLDWPALLLEIRAASAGADLVLVEGAGGVLSPLTWDRDAIDLSRALDAKVILVAADRLGTISTTHAAVLALHAGWGLPAAIVLSAPAEPDASSGTNGGALRRRLAPLGSIADHILELPRGDLASASLALSEIAHWVR